MTRFKLLSTETTQMNVPPRSIGAVVGMVGDADDRQLPVFLEPPSLLAGAMSPEPFTQVDEHFRGQPGSFTVLLLSASRCDHQ